MSYDIDFVTQEKECLVLSRCELAYLIFYEERTKWPFDVVYICDTRKGLTRILK